MLRFRVTYESAAELRRAIDDELARGVLLVKIAPPDGLQFREVVALELAAHGETLEVSTEVASLLPGVGVAVAFPAARLGEARALLRALPAQAGAAVHAIVAPEVAPKPSARAEPPSAERSTFADKVKLALHGTRDDRASILREQNRALHQYVLKSASVTLDEVIAWAKSPQTAPDFLKQIGERSDWLSRPMVAQALVRNPKTPGEVAIRALDHVGQEALRQLAKGTGAPPHVVQAARKKIIAR